VPEDIEHLVETLDFVKPGTSILISVDDEKSGISTLYLLVEESGSVPAETREMRRRAIQLTIVNTSQLLVNHILFCKKGVVEKTTSGKKKRGIIAKRFLERKLSIIF
jgi:hypothetical protein